MKPKCVFYKYRQVDANTLATIESGKVWFSSRDQLNDPYDCSPKIVRDINEAQADELFHSSGAYLNGNPSLEEKLCLIESSLIKFAGKCGVFCVSATPCDELMWAHYADSHSGIAIGYAVEKQNINNAKYPHRSPQAVLYDGRGIAQMSDFYKSRLKNEEDGKAFNNLIGAIYFSKNKAWSYENEFRFLSLREHGLLDIDAKIHSIVFGAKTPEQHISLVQKLLPKNVKQYQIVLSDDGVSCEPHQ